MNKLINKYCLILAISCFLSVGGSGSAWADDILLLADEWCPYNCVPNSNEEGFAVDIARAAFEPLGHKIIYKNMPWERAIETAAKGEASGIIGAFKEDAPDFYFPKQALCNSGNDFFILKGNKWRFESIKSLENITLGSISGYSYGDELDEYISKNKLVRKKVQAVAGDTALDQNIKKLLAGRVDVVVEDNAVMFYSLKQSGNENDVVMAGSLGNDKAYIAFSPKLGKKGREYAKILSAAIAKMKKSGQYKKIMNKYGL